MTEIKHYEIGEDIYGNVYMFRQMKGLWTIPYVKELCKHSGIYGKIIHYIRCSKWKNDWIEEKERTWLYKFRGKVFSYSFKDPENMIDAIAGLIIVSIKKVF